MSDQIRTYGNKMNSKNRNKLILLTLFLILAIGSYVFFFGTPQIVGNTVLKSEKDTAVIGEGVKISADMTIPELSTKGKFTEIIITGQPSSSFYISDQKIEIPSTKQSTILLKQYDGKISLDRNSINLDGEAERIFTEDIPISSKFGEYTEVQIGEEFDYVLLEIKDFSFNSLEYEASGTIIVDDSTSISLNNEGIKLENFLGTIKVADGRLKLDGEVSGLTVDGDNKLSVSS